MKQRILQLWGNLPIPNWLRWLMIRGIVQKYTVGVVAAITNGDGQILMFRHTYRGRYPWGLPSGWLEPGEDPGPAIEREIREEAGLAVRAGQTLLVRSAREVRHVDVVISCEMVSGDFRPSAEVTEMRWFSREALPPMLESQYDMISKILNAQGARDD